MTVKQLNHYKALFDGGTSTFCDAANIIEAAELFSADSTETLVVEPTLIQKIGSGIKVILPDAPLQFETAIDGDTAIAAGCKVYPAGGNVVRGQHLFLSAVPATGYDFVGWYDGTTLLSANAEAEVVVESTATVPSVVTYTAKFELS